MLWWDGGSRGGCSRREARGRGGAGERGGHGRSGRNTSPLAPHPLAFRGLGRRALQGLTGPRLQGRVGVPHPVRSYQLTRRTALGLALCMRALRCPAARPARVVTHRAPRTARGKRPGWRCTAAGQGTCSMQGGQHVISVSRAAACEVPGAATVHASVQIPRPAQAPAGGRLALPTHALQLMGMPAPRSQGHTRCVMLGVTDLPVPSSISVLREGELRKQAHSARLLARPLAAPATGAQAGGRVAGAGCAWRAAPAPNQGGSHPASLPTCRTQSRCS